MCSQAFNRLKLKACKQNHIVTFYMRAEHAAYEDRSLQSIPVLIQFYVY